MFGSARHGSLVIFHRSIWIKGQQSRHPLRYIFCRYDCCFYIQKLSCLFCSHNNVLVVRQDQHALCADRLDRVDDIFCRWVHRLAAFDNVRSADAAKQICDAFAHCNCHYCIRMNRLLFWRIFLEVLADNINMLLAHIFYFHADQASVVLTICKHFSWFFRMDMNFCDFVISDDQQRISILTQIRTE